MSAWLVDDVAAELSAHREDRVRSVHQDGPGTFRLDLRGPDGRCDLVIVLDAPCPHVHLAEPRPAPPQPSPLAGTLRRLLRSARLLEAWAVPGERALALRLERGEQEHVLWVELFGAHANLYVLDADGTVVMTPRGDAARRRGASNGSHFEPVPARAPTPAPTEGGSLRGSEAVRALLEARSADPAVGGARPRLLRYLRRKQASLERTIAKFEAAATRGAEADQHQQRGILLQGAFHLFTPGAEVICVPDYSTDPPGEIQLSVDPQLTPGEQVAACFRAERKCRRAAAEVARRLPAARAALDAVTRALAALPETEQTADLLEAIADLPADLRTAATREIGTPVQRQSRQTGPARALPFRMYRSADGWRILVGRDARGNDELTLHVARPQDLFLHVRGATGSHVIVPIERGKTVPKETLLDAAELACLFSDRRGADRNEVDYTPRRHVRKPRGAARGLVTLGRLKTLGVRRDEARRARLLAAREVGPST